MFSTMTSANYYLVNTSYKEPLLSNMTSVNYFLVNTSYKEPMLL